MRPFCSGCFGGLTIDSLNASVRLTLQRVKITGSLNIKCTRCGRVVCLQRPAPESKD